MPRIMEKSDWVRTVANVGTADRVWSQNMIGHVGPCSVSFPEDGEYQVILVKIGKTVPKAAPRRKSAHDYIGYCRKYHPEYRSTAEIMKDLREGEED